MRRERRWAEYKSSDHSDMDNRVRDLLGDERVEDPPSTFDNDTQTDTGQLCFLTEQSLPHYRLYIFRNGNSSSLCVHNSLNESHTTTKYIFAISLNNHATTFYAYKQNLYKVLF